MKKIIYRKVHFHFAYLLLLIAGCSCVLPGTSVMASIKPAKISSAKNTVLPGRLSPTTSSPTPIPPTGCTGTDPGSSAATAGLYAEYYSGYFNDDPSFFVNNTPTLVRVPETSLNYTDSFSSAQAPIAGTNPANFSARYRGSIYIATGGFYTFYLTTDDASYLWLDNAALDLPAQNSKAAIANGGTHPPATEQATVYLTVGLHNLLIHYGQSTSTSRLLLEYAGPGVARTVVNSNVLCSALQPVVTTAPVSVTYSPASGSKTTTQAFNSVIPAINSGGSGIIQCILTSATAQSLPAGITVSNNGVISADASVPIGNYSISLTVINSNGAANNGVSNFPRVYSLTVSAVPAGCTGTDPGGSPATAGFYAEYYTNYFYESPNFFVNRAPTLVRVPEAALDYTNNFLSTQAPIAGASPIYFSAQYRGSIYIATAGTYTFYLTSDNASYLWLDNAALDVPAQNSKAIIDHGGNHGPTTMQNSVYLTVGLHNLLIYYGQEDSGSRLLLEYSGPGIARTVVNSNVLCSARQPLASGVPVSVSYSPALGVKTTGQTFNSTVPAVNNGGSPITQYILTSATAQPLPAGITVGTNGVISADASVPVGDYSFNLTLVNANGVTNFPRVYKLIVSAAPLGGCGGTDPGGNPASVGFYAEYYSGYFNDDPTFFVNNTPGLVRVPDAPLDYSNSFLSSQAPIAGSNPQSFSAQYRASIYIATAGTYIFYLTTDDGSFLWLDNAALDMPAQISKAAINHGGAHGAFTKQVSVNLAVGLHPMLVHYGQGGGTSRLMLEYEGPGIVRQVIPANVLCTSIPRPVANNDSYETDANVPLQAVSVLLNDSSPTGIALTVNTTPKTNPLHGSVTLQSNGTFDYTPSTGYIGQDSFTYEVCNSTNSSYCIQAVVSLIINDPAYSRVGSAIPLAANCFVLTPNTAQQAGAVWRKSPVSLNNSFELNFNARFSASGTTKDNGADGITFTLQRKGLDALGSNGSGMGYAGIAPSLGIKFDSFSFYNGEPPYDYSVININGDGDNATAVAGPVQASATSVDIEDGIYHAVKIIWIKADNRLEIYFDGTLRLTYTNDLINTIFGGDPAVYAGFTAGTGGAFNEHSVCDIIFSAINDAPVFTKGANQTVNENAGPQTVAGWAINIDDGDPELTQILTFTATNNNNALFSVQPAISATGTLTYTPAPNANGVATVTVTLSDNGSNVAPNVNTSAAQTFTITVNPVNSAPVFTKGANQTVNENAGAQTVAGWATGIDDGDPEVTQVLTFNVTNNNNALFSVQPAINATGTLTYTPAPSASGVATVSVTLSDNGSNVAPNVNTSAAQTFTITIVPVNNAPVFTKGANQTVNENAGAQTVVGWATSIDDGDPELTQTLTFTTTNSNNALFSVQPTISASGMLTYTPAPNANGVATVTVTLSDNGSNTAPNVNTSVAQTFTITVNAVNDAPVAVNDVYSINEDNILTISAPGVLANDTDADNNALTAVLVSSTSNGILTLNANGSFNYIPSPNFNGTVSFTYRASDGSLTSNLATVTITVNPVNDAPVAVNDAYSINEDNILTIDPPGVLSNDTDPEGSALTTVLVTPISNGSLTLGPDGRFTYTPPANFNGTANFTYRASDGSLSSNLATVTITVNPVNDAPVARDDQASVEEDKPVSIDVLQNDSDVDGDALTITILSPPAKGTVKKTGNGTYEYTPQGNFYGEDSFTYEVCDNGIPVLCNQAKVVLTISPLVDQVVLYEGISPNGDGMNDTWIIENIDDHPKNSVRIFNRWGDLVFEQQDYDNEVNVWKGNANRGIALGGDQLPNGTYFYTIELINSKILKKGSVVINR